MLLFLPLFVQVVWGTSALKAGLAYLPLSATIMMSSGAAARLGSRTGARPLLLAGATAVAGGLCRLSRAGGHGSYLSGVLGPMLVTAAGLGLLFVLLTVVAMSRWRRPAPGPPPACATPASRSVARGSLSSAPPPGRPPLAASASRGGPAEHGS